MNGEMPRQHPRVPIVQRARLELGEALGRIISKHDLTYAELLSVLNETAVSWAGYAMRDEREAESGTGADE